MTTAIKVTLVHDFPNRIVLPGYEITVCDPFKEIERSRHFKITDFISGGRDNYLFRGRLYSASGVDRLYRQRDPTYMRLATQFVEQARDSDILILANYNPIHPEILFHELKKPIKILGLVDDPFSSYVRGLPYLWAFDGAFYISPSYDEHQLFEDKMLHWKIRNSTWWPLVPYPFQRLEPTDGFFRNRDIDVVYIGKAYGAKIDRLTQLKKRFGKRLHIYGHWPFAGYHAVIRGILLGKPILWTRTRSVSGAERTQIYARAKIGINMHLSDVPRETGNMRMYEVPAHGAMLLCDRAGCDAHAKIFSPETEAVYYGSIDEAISQIENYLVDEEGRVRIAKAGHSRFWHDYEWTENLTRLLRWASELRNTRAPQ